MEIGTFSARTLDEAVSKFQLMADLIAHLVERGHFGDSASGWRVKIDIDPLPNAEVIQFPPHGQKEDQSA